MSGWAVHLDGHRPYQPVLDFQEALVKARIEGRVPDVLLFLEHRPVVTLGNRGRDNHLLVGAEQLASQGIDLIHSSRGGDVTYHGPGQIIMYPIIQLGEQEADSHGYLCNLEEVALRTAGAFGIDAFRKEGMTGGWCEQGKFAAIGIRLRRWVTFHGMSVNVNNDLNEFQVITPCGLSGEAVTSFKDVLGDQAPEIPVVRDRMLAIFGDICGRSFDLFESRPVWPKELEDLASDCGV